MIMPRFTMRLFYGLLELCRCRNVQRCLLLASPRHDPQSSSRLLLPLPKLLDVSRVSGIPVARKHA
jgi:hypothetical protein